MELSIIYIFSKNHPFNSGSHIYLLRVEQSSHLWIFQFSLCLWLFHHFQLLYFCAISHFPTWSDDLMVCVYIFLRFFWKKQLLDLCNSFMFFLFKFIIEYFLWFFPSAFLHILFFLPWDLFVNINFPAMNFLLSFTLLLSHISDVLIGKVIW